MINKWLQSHNYASVEVYHQNHAVHNLLQNKITMDIFRFPIVVFINQLWLRSHQILFLIRCIVNSRLLFIT